MKRLTISLDDTLAAEFDALQTTRGYASRSEAVRDLVRRTVDAARQADDAGTWCVANLSYVYDYEVRSLSSRLLELQHAHHDLVVAVTNVALDHDSSLATMILQGPTRAVRALGNAIIAERGVRFGAMNVIIVAPNDTHDDPQAHQHHGHRHASPHGG
ncbi:putative nickel-responsive regulator [Polymorphobacter multimanifer]|uniref:Putative nickel-responsive regulator n=1 Tax=Polymorphobacter multimanifer TaxID=1070431 RepID=A0A841LKJ5_9SPHN|nr:nickel-responsive transcriptional regulator NikR [Polymorphobacter multimanifer]MBB6229498.1 CopG family nickel-responsive transcriptional regulator [Polymorphobacter multimanifer]GGI89676.1 putative nickel-responsive regulator [Polymorphobacter multimanifer]